MTNFLIVENCFMSIPPICNICEKEEDFQVNIGSLKKLMIYLDNYKCKECEIMETKSIIEKFIDTQTNNIRKKDKSEPIKSKADLYQLLKVWKFYNRDNFGATVGHISKYKGQPLIYIKLYDSYYHLNADTSYKGVIDFLENKENDWQIIFNSAGNKNLVTNRLDGESIKHFYLYKDK